jgi:serine---pyruvate transaminase
MSPDGDGAAMAGLGGSAAAMASAASPSRPEILLTPGPTTVPDAVLAAQSTAPRYHRGPEFQRLMAGVAEGLGWMLETDDEILLLTGSGTGALEAAIVNCFSPGDTLVVVDNGHFGERVIRLARAFGLDVVPLRYEWGRLARAADGARLLAEREDAAGVCVQHSETSTGAVNDLEAIAAAVTARPGRPLLMVDAVSSAGAVPIRGDEWGLDIVCGGSQKALGAPPGVGFVSVSERGWEANARATCPRFYWDFGAARRAAADGPETPWTPAVGVLAGLGAALDLMRARGREAFYAEHRVNAAAVRAGVRALGLDLFGEDPDSAVTVTPLRMPEGLDADEVADHLRTRYGVITAPGQGPLRGSILRIGHLGHTAAADVVAGLAAFGATLADFGLPTRGGDAVGAAVEVYRAAEAWPR